MSVDDDDKLPKTSSQRRREFSKPALITDTHFNSFILKNTNVKLFGSKTVHTAPGTTAVTEFYKNSYTNCFYQWLRQ